MAKMAVGQNNRASRELPGSALQRWHRMVAELGTVDLARAGVADLARAALAELDAARAARTARVALDAADAARATLAAALGAAPPSTPEPPPLIDPRVWFARALKDHPHRPPESKAAYARRLHVLMQVAPVTRLWKQKTLLRRSFE